MGVYSNSAYSYEGAYRTGKVRAGYRFTGSKTTTIEASELETPRLKINQDFFPGYGD